jgi:hypothetical protein
MALDAFLSNDQPYSFSEGLVLIAIPDIVLIQNRRRNTSLFYYVSR